MYFVLIIATEGVSRSNLVAVLHAHGYQTLVSDSKDSALKSLNSLVVDAIIIDYELPGGSALELLPTIQNIHSNQICRTIMLCPESNKNARKMSLQYGVDDAISKPVDFDELILRLNNLFKQKSLAQQQTSSILEINGIQMDTQSLEVCIDGEPASLSLTEFRLLYYFARNPNKVFVRSELGRVTNGANNKLDQRSIDVYIMRLRRSLQKHGKGSLIQTVRGAGYRFST